MINFQDGKNIHTCKIRSDEFSNTRTSSFLSNIKGSKDLMMICNIFLKKAACKINKQKSAVYCLIYYETKKSNYLTNENFRSNTFSAYFRGISFSSLLQPVPIKELSLLTVFIMSKNVLFLLQIKNEPK